MRFCGGLDRPVDRTAHETVPIGFGSKEAPCTGIEPVPPLTDSREAARVASQGKMESTVNFCRAATDLSRNCPDRHLRM
jgi:hypothetical protein